VFCLTVPCSVMLKTFSSDTCTEIFSLSYKQSIQYFLLNNMKLSIQRISFAYTWAKNPGHQNHHVTQDIPWKTDSRSSGKEMCQIYVTQRVHNCTRARPPLDHTPSPDILTTFITPTYYSNTKNVLHLGALMISHSTPSAHHPCVNPRIFLDVVMQRKSRK
jgi:hypothetical protein